MQNDLAFRRDLCSCSFRTFPNRIVYKVSGLTADSLRSRDDGIDHGADGAWKFGVFLNNFAGGSNRPTSFMTHNHDQGNSKMFGSIFNRPHGRCINHVARVTGDKQLA